MSDSRPLKALGKKLSLSRVGILCIVSFISGSGIYGQTQKEFIAGCAVGAFDSYSALKSYCPKQSQTTVLTQPLAYTPQQLDEMNRYAQQGAGALLVGRNSVSGSRRVLIDSPGESQDSTRNGHRGSQRPRGLNSAYFGSQNRSWTIRARCFRASHLPRRSHLRGDARQFISLPST